MDWSLAADLAPYIIGLAIPLGVGIYAFRHHHVNGAYQYGRYVMARSVWNLGLLLEILSTTSRGKILWLYVEAASIPLILIFMASFIFTYAETKPQNFGLVWGSLILPSAVFFLLLFTNGWTGLIIKYSYFNASNPTSLLNLEVTPADWVTLIYSTLMVSIFLGMLIGKFIHAQRLYRFQVFTVILGIFIDSVGIGLAIALNRRELIPPGAAAGNLIVAWGLFRYRLFDLRPIARDTLFENIADLVIVVDALDRVVDINASALQEFNLTPSQVIGKPIQSVLSEWPPAVEVLNDSPSASNATIEVAIKRDDKYIHYDVSPTFLHDRFGDYQGRILVVRNITAYAALQWQLKELNEELEERVRMRTNELAEAYDTTLQGWARALELRDKETEGHSRRVIEMTMRLARALDVAEAELDDIRRGALLHDIGKMAVPDEILRKPDALTPKEREIVAEHPVTAYHLLSPIKFLKKALEIPYCHHERWDGKGYPRGLKGEEIPLAARIFSVVDVWDALQSNRPYRRAWPKSRARAYLRSQSNHYFDPRVVDTFLDLIQQGQI